LGATNLFAISSLEKAKDELRIQSKPIESDKVLQPTSFSTVSITRKFTEEKISSDNRLSLGISSRNLKPGLLGDSSGNIDFSKLRSLQLSFLLGLNKQLVWAFSGAYGVSQSKMQLIDKQTERVNFNLIEISSSLIYELYSNNYFSSELGAGLNFLNFVQVSESGLRDNREQSVVGRIGLKINSPYYFSDKIRFVFSFENFIGPIDESLLLESSSYQVNLEMRL
jgi:hypothetical protein